MTDRKTEILETAAELLESKSFAAFSYQHLADRLGIRKASIHHHFPTKDDLGLALLQWYQANGDAILAHVGEGRTPGETVAAILDLTEEVLLDTNARVCPSGAFEIDSDALSDAMCDGIRSLKQRYIQHLADLLAAARTAGEISFLGEPIDQAGAIAAAQQGAREAAPILGREFFRGVMRQLKRSMGL